MLQSRLLTAYGLTVSIQDSGWEATTMQQHMKNKYTEWIPSAFHFIQEWYLSSCKIPSHRTAKQYRILSQLVHCNDSHPCGLVYPNAFFTVSFRWFKILLLFGCSKKTSIWVKNRSHSHVSTTLLVRKLLSLARSLCACLWEPIHTFSVNQLILSETRQPIRVAWHTKSILNGHSILRHEY